MGVREFPLEGDINMVGAMTGLIHTGWSESICLNSSLQMEKIETKGSDLESQTPFETFQGSDLGFYPCQN